jgi:hypothetical protein
MLVLATVWAAALCWKITGLYTEAAGRRVLSLAAFFLAMLPANIGWVLLFWIW